MAAVVNGTSALQLALRLVGVCKNDEVITQSLTFIATANAISYNNAFPVFLDVDLDTMGLSPDAVENFLENYCEMRDNLCFNKLSGRKISACVPMHTFGFPVHIDKILKICNKWNIPVVEDAAESLGSSYKGKSTGSFGKVGIFSFNGNKIITCGGGGCIVSNDIKLIKKAKHLSTTAKVNHEYEFIHDYIGYNFRMPNLNAALACAQLERIKYFISEKRTLAKKYKLFFDSKGIKFRTENPNTQANYWLMAIEFNNKKERDSFLNFTNKNGVMTRPIWTLIYKLGMYKDCFKDSQRNSKFLEERIVNIPSSVKKQL